MMDLISIGEMLIDFSPIEQVEKNIPTFQQNPGGAPANVACVLSKLGCKAGFIGKVGQDPFGVFCKKTLETNGVDTSLLILSKEYPTTLAFVCLGDDGDREFSFYRNNTADINLRFDDFKEKNFTDTKFFHFGSVSLTNEPSKTAVLESVKAAKEAGCIISYDPNLRLPLWKSSQEAKEAIFEGFKYADILKISDEEAEFLFNETDCEKVCELIDSTYNIPLIMITRAEKGCIARINRKNYKSDGYRCKVVDTTGAGDSFLAGIIYNLILNNKKITELQSSEIESMLNFANALGSLVTRKKGAIPAIPTKDEILQCVNGDK